VISTAAQDLGTGAYTILTQIAAEGLGLPIERVKVNLGDTTLPEGPVAGGSQTSASAGSAVQRACQKLLSAIKERAAADPESPLYGRPAGALAVGNGRIFLQSNPATGEAFSALLQRNGGRPLEGRSDITPAPKTEDPYSKHAFGAAFAEVRINPRLGIIRVPRAVGAFAAGRILNPKTARSQLMGGMIWAISMALLEQTNYDPVRANPVNANLSEYLVPVNADIHQIDVVFVDEKDEHVNAIGVKGIGELGNTGLAAAVANAVHHATGRRLRDVPITLEQIL
jgi:xanthine dehydrogenase YagR molybdenum-binding subunit